MTRRSYNEHLAPLPSDEEIIEVVRRLAGQRALRWHPGVTANDVALTLRVGGPPRLGNGAVKGSWSGTMSGAVRVAPRLQAMVRRGTLRRTYDSEYRRWHYFPADDKLVTL